MIDYNKIKSTTDRLISNFGGAWTHRVFTKGTYNPLTNIQTTTPVTNTTLNAVVTEFKTYEIDGEVVQFGDKKLLVSAENINTVPTPEDVMVYGTEIWKIISVKTISPSGVDIFYKLHVRK